MKLNVFLQSHNLQSVEFAARIGTTGATLSRILSAQVVPRRGLMEAIYRETGGLVTPNDLVGLPEHSITNPHEKDIPYE